jgi:signal transduction histidine kinase
LISFARRSLRGRILLYTSVAIIAIALLAGWVVQRHVVNTATRLAEKEVRASFDAYESLWRSRESLLASASRILSAMSDVRAAFGTGDAATIRDTAGELWSRISDSTAIFVVTDPTGSVIASLGGAPGVKLPNELPVVRQSAESFPDQASGFLLQDGQSFQVVVTPVYVQSGRGPVLLNVLVAGYVVDEAVLAQLKQATGGSEVLFASQDSVVATTLPPGRSASLLRELAATGGGELVRDEDSEYAPMGRPLLDVEGKAVAHLWILRSFGEVRQQIAGLKRDILLIVLVALFAGLVLTQLLARRIIGPLEALDEAASEVAQQNYDFRLQVNSEDELGRLTRTFNDMCVSIKTAREDLVRQERISTISQMATSVIHDLRNPLAAIYGGAEMLVDSDLPPSTVKRLAGNIYRASRSMQSMLTDLREISRGNTDGVEVCRLSEVVMAGLEPLRPLAESQNVRLRVDMPEELECSVQRGRVERMFTNLLANSLDAMPGGGEFSVEGRRDGESTVVTVQDSGPGISPAVRARLFQPFSGTDKKNGMGLGLALSRQTMMDHGGDLWEESTPDSGARFVVQFRTSSVTQSSAPSTA